MKNITQSALAAAVLCAALSISGCHSKQTADSQPGSPVATPTQAAPADSSQAAASAAPANQAPGTTASAGPAPAPATAPAPPPPPPPIVAPIGTSVTVRTTEALSASHNEVGDPFNGELSAPIIVHGATLFPRGTHVTGTVVAAKGRGRFKGSGSLGIELVTIGENHVKTTEYEKELAGKGKRTGALIGGGTGLGAIIGGIAGGGKGALIGGLAGAGAGTAGAAYTGNKDVVIPSESLVTFRLTAPLTTHAR